MGFFTDIVLAGAQALSNAYTQAKYENLSEAEKEKLHRFTRELEYYSDDELFRKCSQEDDRLRRAAYLAVLENRGYSQDYIINRLS